MYYRRGLDFLFFFLESLDFEPLEDFNEPEDPFVFACSAAASADATNLLHKLSPPFFFPSFFLSGLPFFFSGRA